MESGVLKGEEEEVLGLVGLDLKGLDNQARIPINNFLKLEHNIRQVEVGSDPGL